MRVYDGEARLNGHVAEQTVVVTNVAQYFHSKIFLFEQLSFFRPRCLLRIIF